MRVFRGRRKEHSEKRKHSWFGLHQPFDPKYRIVTSGLVKPWVLFCIRLVIAIYAFAACIAHIAVWRTLPNNPIKEYYIYFTRLTFIGITAYFAAAAFHTGFFALSLRQLKKGEVQRAPWSPLQRWGRFWQFLHLYLFSTIITFPIIVTVVYWAFLADAETWETPFTSWANVTMHILNTVFLLVELIFGRVRLYWGYVIFDVITLGLYLGMAYLVHSVQNIWVYSFLDPHKPNAKVAAYIVGIPVVEIIVFVILWGVIHMRDWILPRGRGVRVLDSSAGAVAY
ncbi:hypothetical protein CPB86DRAFT_789617 [Serendipita vermifera]|nr:hypothetical protein CPB86DRAFT_789617 [Serendipita vermifera]